MILLSKMMWLYGSLLVRCWFVPCCRYYVKVVLIAGSMTKVVEKFLFLLSREDMKSLRGKHCHSSAGGGNWSRSTAVTE